VGREGGDSPAAAPQAQRPGESQAADSPAMEMILSVRIGEHSRPQFNTFLSNEGSRDSWDPSLIAQNDTSRRVVRGALIQLANTSTVFS
jgi:hypothetical protein